MNVPRSIMSTWELKCVEGGRFTQNPFPIWVGAPSVGFVDGSGRGTRTPDPRIMIPVL